MPDVQLCQALHVFVQVFKAQPIGMHSVQPPPFFCRHEEVALILCKVALVWEWDHTESWGDHEGVEGLVVHELLELSLHGQESAMKLVLKVPEAGG